MWQTELKKILHRLNKALYYKQPVNSKTALAYFLIKCVGAVFVYFYSTAAFKNTFNYGVPQILVHNLLLVIIQIISRSVLRTYLSIKIHPLKILKFVWMKTNIVVPFLPWLLKHTTPPWQLLLIQSIIIIFWPSDLPGVPIFFKNFPVFK